jgi:hypothetical protein
MNLDQIVLCRGNQPWNILAQGRGCVMNIISFLQGDKFITDHPSGVNDYIRVVAVNCNDGMNDTMRQLLVPLILRMMNTAYMDDDALAQDHREWVMRNDTSGMADVHWLDRVLPQVGEVPEEIKQRAAALIEKIKCASRVDLCYVVSPQIHADMEFQTEYHVNPSCNPFEQTFLNQMVKYEQESAKHLAYQIAAFT